ncbi:MAG: PQQ-dependent sugar dehydrogenase [Gammaproteobacteria bacterium]|nr:PQQ-dependent sugar dehydrogenase [Gammaproteobacteria bacterium]
MGKILRITRDGGIPPNNPFMGANSARCALTGRTTAGKHCQETFATGLRNPFRMAFDPNAASTRFFINDVGQITWEEINLGQAGADYGWNLREGPCPTGQSLAGHVYRRLLLRRLRLRQDIYAEKTGGRRICGAAVRHCARQAKRRAHGVWST